MDIKSMGRAMNITSMDMAIEMSMRHQAWAMDITSMGYRSMGMDTEMSMWHGPWTSRVWGIGVWAWASRVWSIIGIWAWAWESRVWVWASRVWAHNRWRIHIWYASATTMIWKHAAREDERGLALMEILDYAWNALCHKPSTNKVSSFKRYTRDKRKQCNNAREHTKDQRQERLE